MKHTKYIITIGAIFCVFVIFILYIDGVCEHNNCNNRSIKNYEYCIEHKCEWEGCTSEKGAGKSHYCYYHIEQNNLQPQKEIALTDSQVNKAKQVIESYCKELMNKQSNILAVNLINDYPEYVSEISCSFRCNVVREDSDTNLATIHLTINDDDTFKVDRLTYDE